MINPSGLCQCGCGQRTSIATQTAKRLGHVAGEHVRFVWGHHSRNTGKPLKAVTKRYRASHKNGVVVTLHRQRAERALGKPLPAGAQVHHVDGTMGDDSKLVICQDDAYHKLLHWRLRIKKAGGDPNTDLLCSRCKKAKPRESFGIKRSNPSGHSTYCWSCYRARENERRAVSA